MVMLAPLFLQRLAAVYAGRSPHWPEARNAWIAGHPCCAVCDTRRGCEVHHIMPVSWPGGASLELDPANFITLCRPHHYLFGHLCDWQSRNPTVIEDCRIWREQIKGREYPDFEQQGGGFWAAVSYMTGLTGWK